MTAFKSIGQLCVRGF